MTLPSPDDPARAPVWDNYVVSQAVQASLRLIPRSALAVGIEVDRYEVRLHFQLAKLSSQDAADMGDIADELAALLGDEVHLSSVHTVQEEPEISPHDHVRWIFTARH